MPSKILDYFTLHAVHDRHELEQVQHLRWEVYCRDFHFEKEEDCPGELESDIYDKRAIHVYLTHRHTHSIAGCVRVIRKSYLDEGDCLPVFKAYPHAEDFDPKTLKSLPPDTLFEVSRLAVASQFRRRHGEQVSPVGELDDAGEGSVFAHPRHLPMLALTLILSSTAIADLLGLKDGCAMMESRLARLLRRFGLNFNQIAQTIEHHGQRSAYHIAVADALKEMDVEVRELYRRIVAILGDDLDKKGIYSSDLAH